jgi:hypothetical protein
MCQDCLGSSIVFFMTIFIQDKTRRIGYKSAVLLTYTPCLDELNYAFTNLIFPAS